MIDLIGIGKRVKTARTEHKLTREKLAEIVNVTPHYIYEIERGMKAMSLETLANISKMFMRAIQVSSCRQKQEKLLLNVCLNVSAKKLIV